MRLSVLFRWWRWAREFAIPAATGQPSAVGRRVGDLSHARQAALATVRGSHLGVKFMGAIGCLRRGSAPAQTTNLLVPFVLGHLDSAVFWRGVLN